MSAPDELWVTHHRGDEWEPYHVYTTDPRVTAPTLQPTRYIRADAPKADSALADELGRLILESCRCADESLAENDGKLTDFVIKNHDEIDAALRAQPGGAVPREPTEEMLLAVDRLNVPVAPPEYLTDAYCERWRQQFRNGAIEHWRVMWDAATKAGAGDGK